MTTERFQQARELQWAWKSNAMLDCAVKVVKIALAKPQFAADDLPDESAGGQGIVGSVFAALRGMNIISEVRLIAQGDCTPEPIFIQSRRKSRHPSANGRKIGEWKLADGTKARAFLRQHGVASEPTQASLEIQCLPNPATSAVSRP